MMETPAWWESYRTGSADSIRVGEGTQIAPGARLDGASGPIELGRNCQIHDGALLLPYGGSITVGDDCTVNPYTVIYGHGGVQIGNGVRIATHVVIVPANHVFSDLDRPIFQQGLTMEGITIEDDVWIGCNVTILDGARIGTGCVVAAGSVVRGRHAPMSVIGGTPARLLKKRDERNHLPDPVSTHANMDAAKRQANTDGTKAVHITYATTGNGEVK